MAEEGSTWVRDFASGFIVLFPLLVIIYVVSRIYGVVAALPLVGDTAPTGIDVVFVVVAFVALTLAMGALTRTTLGALLEMRVDTFINRIPGLRVVYNALKLAAETTMEGSSTLREPVRIETWDGVTMTVFKTGNRTPDGREIVFIPTAPNFTSGFTVEVDPENITPTTESMEDTLVRTVSMGMVEHSQTAPKVYDPTRGQYPEESSETAGPE